MTARFGKFLLVERIAQGGMGEIFLARQHGLGQFERLVVLKRVRPNLTDDARFESLFLEEARISARLSHPNVVQVFEFGRIEDSYFLTLEHVRGANLNAIMRRLSRSDRLWPVPVLVEVMVQICAGLSYVHRLKDFDGQPLNVIHRDISPSNILVSWEGVVKLLDFGVAHARGAIDAPATDEAEPRGKYPYMSPEQYRRRPLDARTDLFALGVVFWELLTGKRLFRRETVEQTVKAVLNDEVAVPSSLRSDIPAPLDALVMQLLERDPDQRCATAQEVIGRLETLAEQENYPTGPRVIARFMINIGEGETMPPDGGAPELLRESRVRVAARPVENARLKLLIVDDERDNLDALVRLFRQRYEIFDTTRPEEALLILENNAIDILLTDQRMPGMTGIELIQWANELRPQLLKVIISAFVDTPTLLEAINNGAIHRYVIKPWEPDKLLATVEQLARNRVISADAMHARVERAQSSLGMALSLAQPVAAPVPAPPIETGPTAGPRVRKLRLRPQIVAALEKTRQLALLLLEVLPESQTDRVAYYVGQEVSAPDEVLVVAPNRVAVLLFRSSREEARALAERLQASSPEGEDAFQSGVDETVVGPAIRHGLAMYPDDGHDVDELLMAADMALFHAGHPLEPAE
jgi:serine/threonine protein kinase/DNA-binding NarL/FixJ family response regulator